MKKPTPLQGPTNVQGAAQAFLVCSLTDCAHSSNLGACNLSLERIVVCDLLQVLNGRKRYTAAQTSAGLADSRFFDAARPAAPVWVSSDDTRVALHPQGGSVACQPAPGWRQGGLNFR